MSRAALIICCLVAASSGKDVSNRVIGGTEAEPNQVRNHFDLSKFSGGEKGGRRLRDPTYLQPIVAKTSSRNLFATFLTTSTLIRTELIIP